MVLVPDGSAEAIELTATVPDTGCVPGKLLTDTDPMALLPAGMLGKELTRTLESFETVTLGIPAPEAPVPVCTGLLANSVMLPLDTIGEAMSTNRLPAESV
jgi:hypothetical protein